MFLRPRNDISRVLISVSLYSWYISRVGLSPGVLRLLLKMSHNSHESLVKCVVLDCQMSYDTTLKLKHLTPHNNSFNWLWTRTRYQTLKPQHHHFDFYLSGQSHSPSSDRLSRLSPCITFYLYLRASLSITPSPTCAPVRAKVRGRPGRGWEMGAL